MIYLDFGATSFCKPPQVKQAMLEAMDRCASPGRGGYAEAMEAQQLVFSCREEAGRLFDCAPEQVVMTMNGTHGLNLALRSLFGPGDRVVISGFEHNAVTRTLRDLKAETVVAGRRLFDWDNTLEEFRKALDSGVQGAVFTHMSNVFGYILPLEELARMCRERAVPFVVDAAQSAGAVPLHFRELGAEFVAMPGHKGLLGPQGTGLLLCAGPGIPLMTGGTGSLSIDREMPRELPERLEAGTLNVPGIAGLRAGMQFVREQGPENIGSREQLQCRSCGRGLEALGWRVFRGPHQGGTLSCLPDMDCQQAAELLAEENIAVRAGLHCAPLAHESAGTLSVGTLRVSFGWNAESSQTEGLFRAVSKLTIGKK